jgi:N-methylhydantoinase A
MDSTVGADVGGTFTDMVAFDGEHLRGWKTPTTAPQSDGVVTGLSSCRITPETVFLHGTTVATNALLEGKGARVCLITTPGFKDVVEIGRQKRPSLYDGAVDRPDPLVERGSRIGYDNAHAVVEAVRRSNPESIAVTLLNSYLDATAELELARILTEAFPGIPISIGSVVSPGFREYERTATTVLNAYLTPVTSRYLEQLKHQVPVSRADVMTSAGGLLPFSAATEVVGQLTLSGPAAGVVAADALKIHHRLDSAVSFDMGGTSTDVCRIGPDGVVLAPQQMLEGRVNRVPSMPINTVGAGGGSIGWRDQGGALRVGPHSAGADPGPACYGKGGTEPTVTDANLALGYIPSSATFAGDLKMSRTLALAALSNLGDSLGLSALDTARGIIEVVDAHMERAIRSVSVEEGFDPRESSLIAFGGAGGLHAVRLARSLGMRSVLIPPFSGVFSAVGLLLSKPRIETMATILSTDPSDAGVLVERLAARALSRYEEMFREPPLEVAPFVDARYVGQSHEVMVPFREGQVSEDFRMEHRRRFGFALDGVAVELVNGRVVATGEPPLTWAALAEIRVAGPPIGKPIEILGVGETVVGTLWRRETLPAGHEMEGPAIVVDNESSTLLEAGDHALVTADGSLEITW